LRKFVSNDNFLASYNKKVDILFMRNIPQNAKYISPIIQKEILQLFDRKIQNEIREDIDKEIF
jgi:hypothetical protein